MLAYGEWVKVVDDVKEFLDRLYDNIAILSLLGSWVLGVCGGSVVVWMRGEAGSLLSCRASGSIVPPLRGLSRSSEGDLWRGIKGDVEATLMGNIFAW